MFYVYILTNKPHGTLYIGVTNDLVRRVWEHKEKLADGFTKRHLLNMLVYYEVQESIEAAITREKQMKKWERNWKLRQIMDLNPEWKDLYEDIAT